jgi:hypothetical protein
MAEEYTMTDEYPMTPSIEPSVKETYALLLEGGKPFIGEVTDIHGEDHSVTITNTSTDKQQVFLLQGDTLIMNSSVGKYHILDIERVIPFDVTVLQEDIDYVDKQLTSDIMEGLDISLEEIVDKDKQYTAVEIREDILAQLIFSFNGYDNISIIQSLNDTVDHLVQLTKGHDDTTVYLYNIRQDKPPPKWLLPVVDNTMKVYDNQYTPLEEFFDIKEHSQLPLSQMEQLLYQSQRPVDPSLSDVGYHTHHVNTYLRDCITTATCLSVKGNYKYDMRNNKHPTFTNIDDDYTMIHPADSLNIVGFLYLSPSELKHSLPTSHTSFTLQESTLLHSMVNVRPYTTLQKSLLSSKTITDDLVLTDLEQNIYYTMTERYDKQSYEQLLETLTPSISDILGCYDPTLQSSILNYKDFQALSVQYEIDPYRLIHTELTQLNNLITNNVANYLTQTPQLPKITIDLVQPVLTNEQKLTLALHKIVSMTNIPLRNEYIQKFIHTYTRSAQTSATHTEDSLWLYNKYNNRKILCKHYELLSIYHRDQHAFTTMVTLYGKIPQDGVIHCKQCGEYLCDEDFSLFDGFSDEQPIVSREVITSDVNLLEDYKEADILLVKHITGALGVSFTEKDIVIVLDMNKSMSHDILANIRYKTLNITVTDEHPRVKDIRNKHAKEKRKKTLIAADVGKFQTYIKGTNKIVSFIALIALLIHSAIPGYEMNKAKNLSFIEFNDTQSLDTIRYNVKYIDYCIHHISALCDTYTTEPWIHCRDLLQESKHYDLPTFRNQLMNTIHYIVSPQYPVIQDRLVNYRDHILSSKNVYVNYEWSLFKPLLKSAISTTVNTVLQEKDSMYSEHYILNYTNYPVENISLIQDIEGSQHSFIHELVDLHVSEIMVNKAFLLLFSLSISNYGNKLQKIHSIDLHIERFLQTVDKQKEMRAIFAKHKWESSLQSGGMSYKTLRTKIIPEIIGFYLQIDTDLSPCFNHVAVCNKFIHTHVNNYDLHMLQTKAKRIYQYKPFTVYPDALFKDLSDEFKRKLFKRYCKDPSGNIIKRFLTTHYLGKYLIYVGDELEDDHIGTYEHSMRVDEANYKEIMNAVQGGLPLGEYSPPTKYTEASYTQDIHVAPSKSVTHLLYILRMNRNFELADEHPLFTILQNIRATAFHEPNTLTTLRREIHKAYSELSCDTLIESCAEFISHVQDNKQLKRFESIFINTTSNININDNERKFLQGSEFRYKNMRESDVAKVFELFLTGSAMAPSKLTDDLCFHYLYTIQHTLARLSSDHDIDTGISGFWKLRENDVDTMLHYMGENSSLLHQDIFRKNSINRGFYAYTQPILFKCLLDYISPYLHNLTMLTQTDNHFIRSNVTILLSRYILCFVLSTLVDFYRKLKAEDSDIISMIESKYLELGEDMDIYECIVACGSCIMDLFINLFEVHYDSRWVVSNQDTDDLSRRLSKQKEKEKQQLIQTLDTMSDEKRASTVELQNIGAVSMYHQSMKANEQRIIDEYSSIDEGYDEIDNKEEVDAAISISEGVLHELSVPPPVFLVPIEETGYYNEQDFDEDGVTGDELHEFSQEDILDNEFQV